MRSRLTSGAWPSPSRAARRKIVDIWIVDVAGGGQTRLTFDPGLDNAPLWSPDDVPHRVSVQPTRGFPALRQKRLSTARRTTSPCSRPNPVARPSPWTGRSMAGTCPMHASVGDGSLRPLGAPALRRSQAVPADCRRHQRKPTRRISPDSRWFAYQSYEGGQNQIYVRAFPPTGGRFQVSKNGGALPVWRRDGKELFFLSPDSRMMAAAIDTAGQFQSGTPTPLFTVVTPASLGTRRPALRRHEGRTAVSRERRPEQSTAAPLTVVVNWLAAVQK